jgi:hypothetical protein
MPANPMCRRTRLSTAMTLAGTVTLWGLGLAGSQASAQQVATETPPPTAKKSAKTAKPAAAAKGDTAGAAPASGQAVMVVVLVNDEPITNHQIEQRQRFLGLSAPVGDKAQANFRRSSPTLPPTTS